jgi:arsenate reductase (thioredoxin)
VKAPRKRILFEGWRSHMRTARTEWVIVAALVVFASAVPTDGRQAPVEENQKQTVLFMCPHGAAKSVLASAYFQRLAKQRGLNVRVQAAGTEPDPTVSPAVAAHLERQGYSVPVARPRKVTDEEFASADIVVSLGCDLSSLPPRRGGVVRWDEVPPPSEDFARADEAIRKRVTDLVDELVRAAGARKH